MEELFKLVSRQQNLLKNGISIMVNHYHPSGNFSFVVIKHNGDASGWDKISPFMSKGYYSYSDALKGGFEWYENYLTELESRGVVGGILPSLKGTDNWETGKGWPEKPVMPTPVKDNTSIGEEVKVATSSNFGKMIKTKL